MNVTKHIICELTGYRPGVVDVSQGDRRSRAVSCRLLENGAPWMIPEGATARVAYTLPDGTEGLYDALPDGSPAGEISGNTVTVALSDQLMAQKGMAQMSVVLIGPAGGQLATWPIRVMVGANSAARLTVPENMPSYGAGFAGKIFFGGADGTVTPLGLGAGVEIVRQEDGGYVLVAYGGGGGGIQEETDPTVPDWAKEPQKPSYTAQEVGALPAGTKIPAKTSDLTNDAGFITKAVADLIHYYTKQQTEDLIAQIPKFRISVVQQLPAVGEERVLYLVPFATAEGQYLEYIWADGRFEPIGSQQVDLTGYATEEWVQAGYQPRGDYLTEHQDISHLLPRAELPGAVAAQIQAFEQGHDLELITSFKLTEAVSSLDITADAGGQPFSLETATFELHTGTAGECGEGSSGAVGIRFMAGSTPLAYLYTTTGFSYQSKTSAGFRDTGITAYATVRNRLSRAHGKCGDFGTVSNPMGYIRNFVYTTGHINKVQVLGNLPVNAVVSVYGVRVGKKMPVEELPNIVGEAVEEHLDTEGLPGYWLEHLALKIPAIDAAVELAGKNKSAFYFYTDAHRISSAGRTPDLLRYLYRQTGINKTNSGGDFFEPFAEGADALARMREHMADLRGLPNHHSVIGNHDEDNAALTSDQQLYGFYLAWEEDNDIVWGGYHYYYIDNRAERTRYLYLDTGKFAVSDDEMRFVIDALTTAPEGWHIVSISHIWYDYQISAIPDYAQHLLDVFDACNLRAAGTIAHNGTEFAYDFTKALGTVAFCIGGHTHWDAVLHSAKGIPVILTDSDSYYSRSGIDAAEGTTGECCFDAVVADYDAGKIKLIRIGRGADRTVPLPNFDPEHTYTNQLLISTDINGGIYNGKGWKENTRIGATGEDSAQEGMAATGFIPCGNDAVIRVKSTGPVTNDYQNQAIAFYAPDKTFIWRMNWAALNSGGYLVIHEDGSIAYTLHAAYWTELAGKEIGYCRLTFPGINGDTIVTIDEVIA